jgi:hypothetical protein
VVPPLRDEEQSLAGKHKNRFHVARPLREADGEGLAINGIRSFGLGLGDSKDLNAVACFGVVPRIGQVEAGAA